MLIGYEETRVSTSLNRGKKKKILRGNSMTGKCGTKVIRGNAFMGKRPGRIVVEQGK